MASGRQVPDKIGGGGTTDLAGTYIDIKDNSSFGRVCVQGYFGAQLLMSDLGGGSDDKNFQLFVDGGIAKFRSDKDDLALRKNNILVMDMGSGNVGIGTSSPQDLLDIEDTSDATLRIHDSSFDEATIGATYLRQDGVGVTHLINNRPTNPGRIAFDTGGTPTERMSILYNGNVGIGTNSPTEKLEIGGETYPMIKVSTNDNSGNTWLQFGRPSDIDAGGIVYRHNDNYLGFRTNSVSDRVVIDSSGNVGIGTTGPTGKLHIVGTDGKDIKFSRSGKTDRHIGIDGSNRLQIARTDVATDLAIDNNGNVGIGTLSPQSKLAVNGTITCKEVNVTESGWSDFVFEDEYDLPELSKIESYIKKNKHLPDIPSAKEMREQGLSVSEMMAKQMQKIEELTLYVIEQSKKMEEQNKEIESLKKELSLLKRQR